MPFALTLLSLLLGVAVHVDAAGRTFTVSWVDLVAVAVAALGAAVAWRRRVLVVDLALAGYGALLVVVAVQVARLPDDAAIVGGSSRIAVPALVVLGGSQLVRAPGRPLLPPAWSARLAVADEPWQWPALLVGFGLVLTTWILVLLVAGLLDSGTAGGFYVVKNRIAMPLGASNYLAAFVLAPLAVALGHVRRSGWWLAAAGLLAVGLAATLSRGAGAAGLGVLALAAVDWRRGALPAPPGGGAPVTALAPVGVLAWPAVAQSLELGSTGVQRLELFRRAWDGFLGSPLYGVGLNRFGTLTSDLAQPHVHAHNLELQALAELGVVGAAAYLGIWAVLALRAWRLPQGPARTGLLLAVAGLFAHAQVEALSSTRAYEVLLALLLVVAGARDGATGIRTLRLPERGAA